MSYNASSIDVLEGLEPVRKRPGMYIGGTDSIKGLHHLIKEIVDNSIDEAINGHASKIEVRLHSDGETVTVEDNGRGIPVDLHPKYKKPALELILTTLHSGGKFSDNNYFTAGGLHGVGSSVVNALSQNLTAVVWRDGYEWKQEFSRGLTKSKLIKVGKSAKRGTAITFSADPEIFTGIKFKPDKIEQLLREKAYLNKGVKILFVNDVSGETKEFLYPDGIQAYLRELLAKSKENEPLAGELFYIEKEEKLRIQAAFAWSESTEEQMLSYVNGIPTSEGGTHLDGFKNGIVKAVRNYITVHDLLPKGIKLTGEDIREGLTAVLSVWVPGSVMQLQFQGQTKERLNNPEIEAIVEATIKSFENILNSKPTVANQISERVIIAARARQASRAAAQAVSRKIGVGQRLNLPGKLADCSTSRTDKSELIIVEGDSAGGTAKQGRDRETQAVLPLRGKILNSLAVSTDKILDNREIADLVSALGCGIGDGIKLDKLRYGKVLILTDADADGMHIASLLLAFFFKFMRPLIEKGHVYIACSPLYRIKMGGEIEWAYSDQERDNIISKRKSFYVTRFKGLGEMNASALWETTLNPKKRVLLRVGIDNIKDAESMFDSLMGKDASKRYELIKENVDTLDVDL